MRSKFVRRSLLYVPGSSLRKIEKAIFVDADSIILDLEDSVSILEKDAARLNVLEAIEHIKESGKEVIVRINSMDTYFGIQDLIAIVEKDPDTILIPKADVNSVKMVDKILDNMEEHYGKPRGKIGIIPLLETTNGILDTANILKASSRINGVQLGAEDLTKELSIERTSEGKEISFARHMMTYAACMCDVDIIDTPFTGIHDTEGLECDTKNAKSIGLTGKTCIYPPHAEIINKIFSPTENEVENAKLLLKAFEEAIKEGKGACMFEGKMIDNPIAERARKLIEKEEFILKNSSEKNKKED